MDNIEKSYDYFYSFDLFQMIKQKKEDIKKFFRVADEFHDRLAIDDKFYGFVQIILLKVLIFLQKI